MSGKEFYRVVFYSKEDMSAVNHLSNAEKILNTIDLNSEFEINDLLEIYHIKLYLDNGLYLSKWNEDDKIKFNYIVKILWEKIKVFWIKIDNENIINYIESLDFNYHESFWDLLDYFKVYPKISKSIFASILDKFKRQIIYILSSKNVVSHFDVELKHFLIDYEESAELLLAKIVEKHRFNSPKYCFPKSLNPSDKENIISKYLDNENANLNYVRLIIQSKDSDLKLSPKVRLKAKKKSEELNKRILDEGYTWKEGIQVAISKDQIEPVKLSKNGHILEASYSLNYLDQQTSSIQLFKIFSHLFEFTDSDGLITLVSKKIEQDVLERIKMESKNEYSTGYSFSKKSGLSHMQLLTFKYYLKEKSSSIEDIIDSYLNDFLKPHFEIDLRFKFPSKEASYLEKIRILAPEFDSLLKQFQIYTTENYIDFELLEIDSNPLYYSQVDSLVEKKYVYIKSDQIIIIKNKFFSDQSSLYYVEKFKNKYRNLYSLIVSENVTIEDFADYQKTEINKLIGDEILIVESSGFIRIKKDYFILLIGLLKKNEVLSYWHFPNFIREVIDEMVNDDLLSFESKLFTVPEQKYFNFYLNKKEFTNGLDLRNKYLHGTNSSSVEEQENDYYILLKLLILIFLKIEDDLIIKKHFK